MKRERRKRKGKEKGQSRGRVQIQVVDSREQKEEFGGEVLENAGGGTRDSRRPTEESKSQELIIYFLERRENGFD